MPSTRALAKHKRVSRSAAVDAYEELIASGFLVARAGSATMVEEGARRAALSGVRTSSMPRTTPPRGGEPSQCADSPRYNLLPGFPDPVLLNNQSWRSAWRKAAAGSTADWDDSHPKEHHAHQSPYHFFPDLRLALADHIRRTRGIVCAPEDIFIFPGFAVALRILVPTLVNHAGPIAFENPGFVSGRRALEQVGYRLRPITVNHDGISVDHLKSADVAVYVTPAHQYPLGARMSVDRRRKLLEWAAADDRLIFEDDYDGEFRYDVPPMPALRSMNLGGNHVVYLGTASKVLSRDLRIAWAVVPERFREIVRQRVISQGDYANPVAARALTYMLESGSMIRQIASSQRTYGARRAALTAALNKQLPEATLHGIDAGLHLVLTHPRLRDDVAIVRKLASQGLICVALSETYLSNEESRSGLICGYSRLPESLAASAAGLLADVINN